MGKMTRVGLDARYSAGFALIEMIGVLAIMAILAGAMAPFLLNQIDNTQGDAEQLALEAIAEGVRQYYLDESVPANYGNLPVPSSPPPWPAWPAAGNWADALAPNDPDPLVRDYVSGIAADVVTNNRDVVRLYVREYDSFAAIPRVSIISHLMVGGAAPTDLPDICVGNAQVAEDPCGDSPGLTTDDMPDGIANGLIKVVNLNLAQERSVIIERVKNRYLSPAVEFFESLPNDVCKGIPDRDFAPANVHDLVTVLALPGVNGILSLGPPAVGVVELNDFWGQPIKVSKFNSRIIIWSDGPTGLDAVTPGDALANPLYMTATCAPGSDVLEQLEEIADTVVGYTATQNPVVLPAVPDWDTDVGLSATDIADPWGTAISYTTAAGSFTLTSYGADAAVGGDDDVPITKSSGKLVGLFAAMGRGYPEPDPSPDYGNCAAVDVWMTTAPPTGGGCNTALGYLINASNCNPAIAYDQECAVAGY